jgi:sulfate transport system substrate-binding protein
VALGVDTAELESTAWQVAASFAPTDDAPSFRGISPRKPFDPQARAWGALELKLRYTALRVDDAAFPVLDTGARGATVTFVERGIGDVLVAWENEALLAARELGKGKFEIVTPSTSILAEPPVAVVDRVAGKRKTAAVAKAYLEFLYTPEGQELAAKNGYRPRDAALATKYASQFPKVTLFTIDQVFGGWAKAQKTHFDQGGVFDRLAVGR